MWWHAGCTAKTKWRKFGTNIPRKGISGPQFPHSCVCERIIYSHDGSAFSAGGNMYCLYLKCWTFNNFLTAATKHQLSNCNFSVYYMFLISTSGGSPFLDLTALQRQNAENLKQIFPEKEYRASVPISTFMCLWVNYIFPWWVFLFCWRKYVDWSWEYINRSKTHGNWGWGRAIPRKGICKRNCRCSALPRK